MTSQHGSRNLLTPLAADLARNLPLGDLLALGNQLHADITLAELLRELAETLHRVVPSPQVYIRLRNADTDDLEAVAFAGLSDELQTHLRATPVAPAFYQSLLQPRFHISESFLIPIDQQVSCEPDIAKMAGQHHDLPTALQPADMLLVPLRSRGERLLGLVYLVAPEAHQTFALDDIQVLEAFVRQAALTLENVRLAERGARLLAKEQLLAELGRDVSATLEIDRILDHTIARLGVAFQSGSIALFDETSNLAIVATVGGVQESVRNVRIRLGTGIIGCVAQHGRPYFSNNLANETDNRFLPNTIDVQTLCGHPPTACSYIAVPLLSGGRVIGSLQVGNSHPDAFSYEDVDLLEAIAAQISGPINSAFLYQQAQRLAEQVQRRVDQLAVLNTIARIATATLNMQHMLTEATDQIQRGFGYDHVELFLVDEGAKELVRSARSGRHGATVIGYRQHMSMGILGRTVRSKQTQRIDDVQSDTDYVSSERTNIRSELCVPIVAGIRVWGC